MDGKIVRILLIVLIVAALFLLTGCGYGETKGHVVEKKYTSAFTTTTMIHTGKTMMPMTQYHPESWKIQIQKEEERSNKDYMD